MTSTPGSPDWICLRTGRSRPEAGAVVQTPVRLMAEELRLKSRSTPVTFVLIAADDDRLSVREETRFLGPPP